MNYVFRCPGSHVVESFRVVFAGRLCSPDFNSKGAASAYLNLLQKGRKPEYA